MPHASFVHLRVHSAYSLSEGALRIKDIVSLCKRFGMPAVALTDTDNLFGAIEFSTYCSDAGIQPIIGSAIAVRVVEPVKGESSRRRLPDRMVFLAQTQKGYDNLIKLASLSYMESPPGEPPQVGLEDLVKHGEGLIVLSGGPLGPVGRLLQDGQADAAEALLLRLADIFPGRFYIELQRHGLPMEKRVETLVLPLAHKHNLPLVATNEAFFTDVTVYDAHDALLCIADGAFLGEENRRRLTPEHRFKSPQEMDVLFRDLPEAIRNTLVIARRCAVMAPLRKPILPRFPTTRTEEEEIREQSVAGLEQRLAVHVFTPEMDEAKRAEIAAPYRKQLDFELNVIITMGFAGYFLIVADFIRWAKEQDIPVGPGRGSGAGSLVAWSLTITDLDPLRFGLIFERFLNPDRISMPDFDIDFCQERRDEVIRYVQERYGRDRVAQIITFGTLQARAALRDVGRVLQLPYGLVDKLCKMVPNNPANPVKLEKAIEGEPRFQHMRREEEGVDRLVDIALKLEGLYRHASTHAAGVVIADRPLDELVPLYRDPRSDMPVTQFSMKYVEMAGLVKFDFLGLKTLSVIQRALKLIEQRGIKFDILTIPLDDERTYEMLQRAEAIGVFQFESSGMRDLLREAKPTNIEDLIALVALYRPGPMENIPKYIACKHGKEEREFLHELIEPVVADTYGVIIYQEQVLQIAQRFAGYSLGEADILRRAMGKKIKAEMEAQRATFVKGAMERGVPEDRGNYVFDLVDKFAGYGFNKAHSAGYALVAYQTAWLKANYPVEFLAASMDFDLANTDKLNVFRQEAKRMGVAILPPDINRSGATFTVEPTDNGVGAIRYALAAIRNVGKQAMEGLVAERNANGRFKTLYDFAQRLDPTAVNKRQIENLVRAGAFDSLNKNRAHLFGGVETMLRHASAAANERTSNQSSLFGAALAPKADLQLPASPPWKPMDLLTEEFSALGFHLTAHPLDVYETALKRIGVKRFSDVARRATAETLRVKLAGIVESRQERTSARGNRFAFVKMSDTSGNFEFTVFSEHLALHREILEAGQKLLIGVDVRADEGGAPRLTAQSIQLLDEAAAATGAGLEIRLSPRSEPSAMASLRALLVSVKGGKGRVSLQVPIEADGREVEINLPGVYTITPDFRAEVETLAGIAQVREI